MSASDVKTISDLVIGPAGALVLAVIVILALGRLGFWLLKLVLAGKDEAITYRDGVIAKHESQLTRQADQLDRNQDLFDQALKLLESRRGGGRTA